MIPVRCDRSCKSKIDARDIKKLQDEQRQEQLRRELEGLLPRYTKEEIEICFKNWRGK